MSADDTDTIDYFKSRGIARATAFFLPHIKAGMNLLDCGCGLVLFRRY